MALNFPINPNLNQKFQAAGKTWEWDGTSWKLEGWGTTYTLPIATASTLGGIKVGQNLVINATTGVLDAASSTQVNADWNATSGVEEILNKPVLVTTFLGLTDTPNSFIGNKWLKVNAGGNNLELTDAPSGGGASTLNDLTDVNIGTGTINADAVLKYNSSNNKWELGVDNTSGSSGVGTLQQVTDTGAITTQEITTGGLKMGYWDGGNEIAFGTNREHEILLNQSLSSAIYRFSSGYDVEWKVIDGTFEIQSFDDALMFSAADGGTKLYHKTGGTTNATSALKLETTSDGVKITGGLQDKDGQLGTAGQVLSSTGTALDWINPPSGGSGASVVISDNAPNNPSPGDLWWASHEGQLKIWYDDGQGNPDTQWVDTGGVGASSSNSGITVKDESITLTTQATTLKFAGAGVQATGSGSEKTITIPGGIQVQNDGTNLTTTCFQLNFTGAGVTASGTDATKTINIPGGGSSLQNIVDSAQGVNVTGKVATTDGVDIDTGGNLNAAGTSVDFQSATMSFSGASISGLNGTINDAVDVHLNKSSAGTNEVLSWNGTDYDWVAQSSGGGGTTYDLEALLSPGIKLVDSSGNADNIFFDAVNGIKVTRTNTNPHTIEFDGGSAGMATANVKSFGAKGDGNNDDTNAINNAIASLANNAAQYEDGGIVYFPPGVYNISSPLQLSSGEHSITLKGSSTHFPLATGAHGGSILRSTSTTANLIEITNVTSISVQNLSIDTSVSKTNGVAIRCESSTNIQGVTIDQVYIKGFPKGIEIHGYSNCMIKNSEIRELPEVASLGQAETHGILLTQGSDTRQDQIRLENVIVDAKNVSVAEDYHDYANGIIMKKWCNSVWIKDCAFLHCYNGIWFSSELNHGSDNGKDGAFHRVLNSDVDHNKNHGIIVDGGDCIWFENCYASSNLQMGWYMGQNFDGTVWVNNIDCRGNGSHGMHVNANAAGTFINSARCYNNGVKNSGNLSGVYVLNGAYNVRIIGGQFGGDNEGFNTGSQQHGIEFVGSDHKQCLISGVNALGNGADGIVFNTSAINDPTYNNFITCCAGSTLNNVT